MSTRSCVVGSFVADAASLGFLWLYDQSRIASICPSGSTSAAFHAPNAADFEGAHGFFVGEGKPPGSLSHCGWDLRVMVSSLSPSGHYDRQRLLDEFAKAFGYGGKYVGYIDSATRKVLDTIARRRDAVEEAITSLPSRCGTPQEQHGMAILARMSISKFGADLEANRKFCETTIRANHDDDKVVKFMFDVLDLFMKPQPVSGADDAQVSALSKVPAIVASDLLRHKKLNVAELEDCIRALHNNDLAVKAALAVARALEVIVSGGTTDQAIAKFAEVDAETMAKAQAFKGTPEEAAKHFGMACPLAHSLPVLAFFLTKLDTMTFRQAIEANIRAGGSTCGRSIIIGALWGAKYGLDSDKGIPKEWADKIDQTLISEVNTLLPN